MARNFQTNLILGGDSRRGVRAMRTVQGELEKTQRKSRGLTSQFRRQNRIAGQLSRSFKTLGITLAGAFSVGATVRTFSRLADEGDRIAKTARNIGVSAQFLQEFRGAGELAGNTVQDIDDALRRFNRRLGLFVSDGSGPAAKSIELLGLEVTDAQGKFIGAEAALDQTIDAIARLPSTAQQAAAASQLFGDDAGPKLVNLLSQGSEGVAELRQQIRDTGAVMSEDALEAAERYADATTILGRKFKGVAVQIFNGLIPGLTGTLEVMAQSEEGTSDLSSAGEKLAESFNVIIRAGIIVRETLLAILEVAVGLGVTVFGAFRQIIAPIEGTIRGLAEASQQLVDGEFRAAANAVRGIGNEIQAAFADAQEQTDRGLGFIGDSISKRVENAIEGVNNIAAGLDRVGDSAEENGEKGAEGFGGIETAATNAAAATFDFQERAQDIRRELAGPLERAFIDAADEIAEISNAFARGEITGGEYAQLLSLIQQRTAAEVTPALIEMRDTFADLAFGTLPPVIQQMLGLADATGRVADSAQRAGALSQIGSNFSRAVINGQGVQSAIGSSLLGFGGQGISEALDATDMAGFFETAFKDGIGAAFEDSEFQRNSAAGYALALSQAVDGNLGQAAFTALGNAIGGEIGALIGSIIGDAVFGDSVSKFQVRGGRSNTATDAGTDRTIGTAFGADLQIAFRGIEDQAKRQIVRGYSEFLNALSGVVRDPAQQSAIASVISEFGISSRSGPDDIEGQLELLFGDILGTFDGFTQDFVRQAETLDGQVQRLDDLLRLDNLSALGRDFGLTFEELATVLDEVAIGGESIIDTFERLEPAVNALQRAADLTGNAFADSAQGLVRFSSELVAIFGDDAGAFSGVLNRVLEAAFSDEQLPQQTIDAARQRATDLLTGLGIAVSEETFTQGGLQDLLNDFLGAFDAEGTAQLLEAGDAIATLIDAQGQLADSSNAAADAQQRLADQQAFLRDVGQQALQVIAPSRVAFADLAQSIAETRARADELNLAEGQLNIVRLAAAAQTLQLVAALEERLESSIDAFTGQDVQSGFDQVQSGISNTRDAWLRAIDSIQSALDAQLVGPNSTLTNRGRLNELESQLGEAVQGALSGDVGAAQQVSQLFQQAIAQGASFFGSTTDDFANFEQRLRELVGSVPGNVTIPPEQQTAANTQRIADSAATREQSDVERLQAAINIVDTLGILSEITGTLPSEISDRLPIAGIIEALTGEVPDLTGEALSGFFDELVFETSQQLNELARIEQVQIDQLSVMGDANDILRGIFDRMGGLVNGMAQFAGAVTEASGTIGGDVNFGPGAGGPALADGGIVTGPTRALIGEAGPEAVIPLQRTSDNRGIERRLERIEAALLTGNANRRDGTEIMVTRLEESLLIQERKRRTDKADILRPGNPQRARA